MTNKSFLFYFLKLLMLLTLTFTLFGCSPTSQTSTKTSTKTPDDMPIDEFIIGSWDVLEVVDATDNKNIEIYYPIVRIRAETMSYGDFSNSEYHFIDKNTISISHKRLIEKVLWTLEKDGERLIIHDKTFNQIITLERNN